MASLPLTTFTADARYDIYAAIITVASTGRRWNAEHVAAELGRRMDWVPEWALPRHGGQGTPWPQAYLRRLADTEPLSYAVPRLLADDAQARLECAGPEAGAQRWAGAARDTSQIPGHGRWFKHTAEPGADAIPQTWRPSIGPGPEGPAPRM
jgi:hypothetical protein